MKKASSDGVALCRESGVIKREWAIGIISHSTKRNSEICYFTSVDCPYLRTELEFSVTRVLRFEQFQRSCDYLYIQYVEYQSGRHAPNSLGFRLKGFDLKLFTLTPNGLETLTIGVTNEGLALSQTKHCHDNEHSKRQLPVLRDAAAPQRRRRPEKNTHRETPCRSIFTQRNAETLRLHKISCYAVRPEYQQVPSAELVNRPVAERAASDPILKLIVSWNQTHALSAADRVTTDCANRVAVADEISLTEFASRPRQKSLHRGVDHQRGLNVSHQHLRS
ncbi:hypothetical protein EVAR_53414_1 [Eumeta japonica]|uniref:Uncharacterized protein n=1 Tax=Eumeta variegata TaxID=151549 RepID=A0A4C1XQX7_EUMVA|nr:hypothetical protein EVAR_53414_1 [Eumeta japonica]